MGLGSKIRNLARNISGRRQVERELDEELGAYVEELTERKVRAGMDPAAARRSALVELEGVAQVKERVRGERIGSALEAVLRDAGYALRGLRRAPGFTLAAVLTIALAVSANSTVFTLVNAALLKDLPFQDPGEIAWVRYLYGVSYRDFLEFRDRSQTVELGAYRLLPVDLSGSDAPAERVLAGEVSAETFSILKQASALGRNFLPDDFGAGAGPVALIGHSLWQNRYAGDPEIVGRSIRIGLVDHAIVGVLPEGEAFPDGARVWLPLRDDDPLDGTRPGLTVFGRLTADSTFARADAEFDTIAAEINAEFYPSPGDLQVLPDVLPFRDRNVGREMRLAFLVLLGAVGCVLLIACVNVANLLLSRAADRTHEVSIRAAMGASRSRLMRQLLVESLVMSFMGGAVGLALSVPAVAWFVAVAANTGPPYWLSPEMDYRVYVHFFLISAAAAALFGLAPALEISGANVLAFLKDGGRGTGGARRSGRLTSVLIVGELALTIVLLTGAGLMLRSFINSQRVDWGVEFDGVLTAGASLPTARYDTSARTTLVYSLVERLQSLPDLGSVTAASAVPGVGAYAQGVRIEGRPFGDSERNDPPVSRISVVPGYFGAMGLALSAGRDFSRTDRPDAPSVAIVDALFASRYWPGTNPIGERFRFGGDENAPWLTVVGVAPRVYYGGPGPEDATDPQALPSFYVPYSQDGNLEMSILSRGGGSIETRVAILRRELEALDADLPLINIRTLDEVLWRRTWPYRIFGTMLTAFAIAALTMAAVGLYGVTAYGVSRRTREIGVRMAVGAGQRSILWMVLRQGLGRILAGLAIGLAAALGLSRLLTGVLYEVTPADPVTFVATSLVLALVTLAACLVPARRAVRVDPLTAIRYE